MRAAFVAVVAAGLVACKDHPSKLDQAFSSDNSSGALDPWSATLGTKTTDKGGDDDGGFDVQAILEKIKDAIDTPGPYESPKKSKDFDAEKPYWGVMGLDGAVVEREAFSLTGGSGTELRKLVMRLRALAKDEQLAGLFLRIESLDISLPDLIELRAAMHDFRDAGKKLYCHTEAAMNATYLVISACDRIALAPLGEVAITGPSAMPIHVKPLLDKLSITADFLHVGAYKGAAEPLTRDAPSKEMEETLGAILDRRYETMIDIVAKERKLDPAAVKTLVDDALFPADAALAKKLVDEVTAWEAFRDSVKAPWTKVEIEPEDKDQLQAMMKIARFLGAIPPERPLGDHVAVVYALGDIKDGGGDGVIGARQEIASHTLVSALRAIAADDSVKAVVLRIDSGGGSAQASELIWGAVEEMKAKKPVIVSMSDVAASGGYYIASGATKIFAQEDTLTGSIGVVGGHIAPAAGLAKLGINTFPMGRGKHATLMSSFSPWTEDEKKLMQANMESVYNVFVSRVAAGRRKTAEQIQPIAQGRVWVGTKAKELGLVDEIGGLDAALAEASKLGKVDPALDVEVYPPAPTLRDLLAGWGAVHAPLGISVTEGIDLAALLDPQLVAKAKRILALVDSFRTTRIQTIAILPEFQ